MGRTLQSARLKRAQDYLTSFSTGDPDSVIAHVHDEFKNVHLGVLGKGCPTRAAYRERLFGFLGGFQDIVYKVIAIVGEGDSVACRYEFQFSQDGVRFSIPGMMWFDFVDDLISRRVDCWDGLAYAAQANLSGDALAAMIQPASPSAQPGDVPKRKA